MQRDLYLEEIQPEDEMRHAWAKTEGLLKKAQTGLSCGAFDGLILRK